MAKQQVTVELYYDGGWHDITADDDVFTAQPIVITRGQGETSPALRPATVTLQLANDDDRYRISNPESPLYGKAGRNTPLRVSVGGVVRAVTQASSWQAGQSRDFRRYPPRGKAWVDVQGGGKAAQINEWTQKLRSALYRAVALASETPAEWWPMEDPAGSVAASSAAGGTAMTPVTSTRYTLANGEPVPPGGAPEFGRGSGITGSDLLPSFQQGGTLRAPIRTTTFDGYAIDWVMQFEAGSDGGGTASVDVLSWRETGTYVAFTVNASKDNVTVFHANAADLETLSYTGSASAALDPYDGAAHHYRYQVRQDGGDYLAQLYIDSAVYATADNFTPGMTGTVGAPYSIEWNPLEDRGDYMPTSAGHLTVWPSGQIGDQPSTFFAINGRAGERTSYRLARLLTEHGIGYFVSASFNLSTPMGPQRPDTLANLLRECLSTEDALLFDRFEDVKLFFLSRFDRYNQTPQLELYPEDLPFLPTELTATVDAWNVVTAAQRDGGDYTARDDTGPLGTQDPPDGTGEYQRRVDVNLTRESSLLQHAYWWLNRGTVDLPRYPKVALNLAALSPDRVTAVEAVDIGDVITITGYREDVIRLTVLGMVETIGATSRTIMFNCAPDQQFEVATYTATGATLTPAVRRMESRTSTLDASYGPGDTSLVVTFTSIRDAWSTTSTPYDWAVAGERITVTSMGAVTGTGPWTQTATVARSVNGVRKSLTAGEPVHMHPAQQARYAL